MQEGRETPNNSELDGFSILDEERIVVGFPIVTASLKGLLNHMVLFIAVFHTLTNLSINSGVILQNFCVTGYSISILARVHGSGDVLPSAMSLQGSCQNSRFMSLSIVNLHATCLRLSRLI